MTIRWFRLMLAGAVALFTPSTQAWANPANLRWQFDGFAGWHTFSDKGELGVGDVSDAPEPDDSIAFGVRLGYRFTPMFGIEAEGAAMPTQTSAGSATSEEFIVAYRLSAKFEFDAGRVFPFLLAGVGGVSNSSERDDVMRDDTDFAWHAGVGARLPIDQDWGFRADARLLLPPSTDGDGVTAEFEGLVGLYKLFGGGEPAHAAGADARSSRARVAQSDHGSRARYWPR